MIGPRTREQSYRERLVNLVTVKVTQGVCGSQEQTTSSS